MQPPNQSLRSRTQTSQPAFARSAAAESPLMPEPTITASCSANDAPELVVGDEPALLHAELLHRIEDLGAPLLRDVEAELVRLDADRVEPALLAQHDAALGRDELGRVRLDRLRVVELARDRTRLAAVQRLAGDRLPPLQRGARQPAAAPRHGANGGGGAGWFGAGRGREPQRRPRE